MGGPGDQAPGNYPELKPMRPEKMIGVILDRVSYDLDRIVEGTLGKIEDEPTREILSVLLRDIKDARRLTLEKEK